MTDPRPILHDMAARGYGLPAARDHANLMIAQANARAIATRKETFMPPTTARNPRESAKTLALLILIAVAFAWMGCALGGAQ